METKNQSLLISLGEGLFNINLSGECQFFVVDR